MYFLTGLAAIGLLVWLSIRLSSGVRDSATRWGFRIGVVVSGFVALISTYATAILANHSAGEFLLNLAVAMLVGSLIGGALGGAAGWTWGGLFEWFVPPRDPGAANSSDEESVEKL